MIDIERLKASVNIVDIIGNYVQLKKAGKNYHACCPFHNEKTPSFTVNEDKQFYHCFGCGAHGDVVGFVENYCGVEFLDAARMLGGKDELTMEHIKTRPKINKLRLPLDGKSHDQDEINSFLSRCELVKGCYFYNEYQVISLTDVHKNHVSIALIGGRGFDVKFFNKQFIYGSCFVFGDVSNNDDIYLCEDYHDCLSINKLTSKASICFFDPLNLYFIYQQLKSKNVFVVYSTDEGQFQADKLNLFYGSLKECTN